MQEETQVPSLGREDPLEEVMATRSSILAGKIPHTPLCVYSIHTPAGYIGQHLESYSPWGSKQSDMTVCIHTVCAKASDAEGSDLCKKCKRPSCERLLRLGKLNFNPYKGKGCKEVKYFPLLFTPSQNFRKGLVLI